MKIKLIMKIFLLKINKSSPKLVQKKLSNSLYLNILNLNI